MPSAPLTVLCLLLCGEAALLEPGGPMLASVRRLVAERGRCTLAEIGDHLRAEGVSMPAGTKLSEFIRQNSDEFRLSGPPNNRKVSLLASTTESALLDTVRVMLSTHGPMTSAELRLRLREQRSSIPGLLSLLHQHSDEFSVSGAAVRLVGQSALELHPSTRGVPAPLVRLHSLGLPTTMLGVRSPSGIREVVLLDLDNRAFALETAACRAVARSESLNDLDGSDPSGEDAVLVLAFCASALNPRLSQRAASSLQALAGRGLLRLLSPERDGANAADFVLAFWAGWLHAQLPDDARFVLISTDADLEQTVSDVLSALGRHVERNPSWSELL